MGTDSDHMPGDVKKAVARAVCVVGATAVIVAGPPDVRLDRMVRPEDLVPRGPAKARPRCPGT